MASLSGAVGLVFSVAGMITGCSPEAHRVRDGGPGADPGNKIVVDAPPANPRAADTTLWPGPAGSVRDPRTGPEPRR
jgi:hypothetical protein